MISLYCHLRVIEAREQTTYRKNFTLNKKLNGVVYFVEKWKMRNSWLWPQRKE